MDDYSRLLEKQNRLLRAILIMVTAMLIIAAMSAAVIVPKAVKALNTINSTVAKADAMMDDLKAIEEDLSKVTKELSSSDLAGLVSDTKTLINNSSNDMQSAMERINSIDFESLNEAIVDMKTAVAPLAKLLGR